MKSNCEHDHTHSHSHEMSKPDTVFKIGISLNLIFVLIEFYYGLRDGSLALVSDAFHNLTDVFGLLLAWLGYVLSKKDRWKKFSIVAATANATFLLLGSLWVIKEAYERFYSGESPLPVTMMTVAFTGFLVNFFSAKLFHKDHHHDLNMRSAYLHLMADAGISLGVVVAGAVIYFTSLYWVDPAVSAVISVIIIFSSWGIFTESVRLLRGKTPRTVDAEEVRKSILRLPQITSISDLRIWALSTAENALTAAITTAGDISKSEMAEIEHRLRHDFKITSVRFDRR